MSNVQTSFRQTARNSLVMLSFLFFIWGFVTWMNYHFIPVLQFILELDKTQEWLMQLVFFAGYLLTAIPAALFLMRVGYKASFITGLITIGLGSILFCGAATYISYGLFLIGFFVMATGITLLQVAGNTYVVLIGNPDKGIKYLCLLQGFNSLGISLIPFIALFLYPYGKFESVIQNAHYLLQPYVITSVLCLILALLFVFVRFTLIPVSSTFSIAKILNNTKIKLASLAIFMYVGAEFFIGLTISYLCVFPKISLPLSASQILLLYWSLAMLGRFAGWYWSKHLSYAYTLQILSVMSIAIVVLIPFIPLSVGIFLLAFLGLCHSVMFPIIFASAINDSNSNSLSVAAVLVLVISGGGIIPLLAFYITKWIDIQILISALALCYATVWYYGHYLKRDKPINLIQ